MVVQLYPWLGIGLSMLSRSCEFASCVDAPHPYGLYVLVQSVYRWLCACFLRNLKVPVEGAGSTLYEPRLADDHVVDAICGCRFD